MIFRAEGRVEILDALKIAGDLKLKAVISGGAEAWKVADALKAAKVSVLVGGTLRLPTSSTDPYDAAYANPPAPRSGREVRHQVGRFGRGDGLEEPALRRGHGRRLRPARGRRVRAVTLAPAEILGVSDQLGSLEVGKRANLVITLGHVLQPTTEVKGLSSPASP